MKVTEGQQVRCAWIMYRGALIVFLPLGGQ
jgi:hypothetical protein